jgi:ubiquinone/menaquinone biosynthesis C-methylase UbiE
MSHRVCPWWLGYFLVNPLRRLWQNPVDLLAPFVREGMIVLEPGCGMGFFTLDVARMVGRSGKVIAVDLQPKMLAGLRRRAARANLLDRIDLRLASPEALGISDLAGQVDLALALHMVHEVPDAASLFAEIRQTLKPGGRLLVTEPRGHVSAEVFAAELAAAEKSGLRTLDRPARGRDAVALLETVEH